MLRSTLLDKPHCLTLAVGGLTDAWEGRVTETRVGFLAVCANKSIVGELSNYFHNIMMCIYIMVIAVIRIKFYGTYVPFV